MSFTLRQKISESSTTTVYRAYHDSLRREVLLKVLHRHIASDDQARERFVREAHACAALRSEHIVQVYDLREHEGAPAIVMEFVEGRSLKQVIADGDLRTFAFTEKVAVHVLRGLAAAHARGIIHRDIKPGNILVSPEGVVKIADFGLAQISVAPTLTSDGVVIGTPAYLAPEVIRGEPADARTDLFSLGATLVETLTGERLFEGDTYADCLNRIAQFRPGMLDRFAPLSSPEFVGFLKRLMDPEKKARFASPAEALEALNTTGSSRRVAVIHPKRRTRPFRRALMTAGVLIAAGAGYVLLRPAPPVLSTIGDRPDTVQFSGPREDPKGDTASRRPAESRVAHPQETAVTQPPDSGALIFGGDTGTKVSIDGKVLGELPIGVPAAVSGGMHAVVFSHPPFDPIVRTVNVERGQRVLVTADFLATAGYIRCAANPWAEISVDDVYRDTTPMDRPIIVSPGTRRVRFHHPSFRDSVRLVQVAPRETVNVSLDLTR